MHNRILRLDILRALAITMVFIAHSVLSYGESFLLKPLQTGGIGVDLFFGLSGWLIGNQLFKELRKKNTIDIKRFWLRRWLRTLPAYYAVLCLTLLQFEIKNTNYDFPYSYFIFIQNYQFPLSFFTISWSLCVEEQFYLVIAPLVLFSKNMNPKLKLSLLVILLITPSIFRFFEMYGHHDETHVSWDCCVMGVLLAYIKNQYSVTWGKICNLNERFIYFSVGILILIVLSKYIDAFEISTPSRFWLAIIFSSWIMWAASATVSSPSRENEIIGVVANYIATRSYAIYLLHPEALAICKNYLPDTHFAYYLFVAIIISLVISEILYRTIELPFMNLRDKFKATQSNSSIITNRDTADVLVQRKNGQ
jgi:peptidoglycan/LPS O-acetylase OafA/YrhL